MANSKAMTKDQLVTKLDNIKSKRQKWEQTEYQASNKILYKMLGRCFDILKMISESFVLQEHLAEQLNLKNITFNKSTSLETRVVRWVFGDCKKRAFLYVSVLQAAARKPASKTMSSWIEANGGLENISRTKKGKSPASHRKKRIEVAAAHFKTADAICSIETISDQIAVAEDASTPFSLALLRVDGTGQSQIVYSSSNVSVIQNLLASAGRDMEKVASGAAVDAQVTPILNGRRQSTLHIQDSNAARQRVMQNMEATEHSETL